VPTSKLMAEALQGGTMRFFKSSDLLDSAHYCQPK